jgi:hypothetical protein
LLALAFLRARLSRRSVVGKMCRLNVSQSLLQLERRADEGLGRVGLDHDLLVPFRLIVGRMGRRVDTGVSTN